MYIPLQTVSPFMPSGLFYLNLWACPCPIEGFAFFCVCAEVLWPSQSNEGMSSVFSLPNHTSEQAYSSKWLISIVHILSPETDNCPSCLIEGLSGFLFVIIITEIHAWQNKTVQKADDDFDYFLFFLCLF